MTSLREPKLLNCKRREVAIHSSTEKSFIMLGGTGSATYPPKDAGLRKHFLNYQ